MPKTKGRQRTAPTRLVVLAAGLCAVLPAGHAHADVRRTTFAVTRNGERIGTNTIDVAREGSRTTIDMVTHIEVTLAFLTLYRFDQTVSERWSDRQLLSLRSRTDDNGSNRQTIATRTGDVLTIGCGDRDRSVPATVMPLDLWNTAVLTQASVLDPQTGLVVPLRAVDRGEDDFVVRGQATRAHRYTITTTYSQDAWYDKDGNLVGVQLTGRDGSIIRYQLS
jgi:hypothetical protein